MVSGKALALFERQTNMRDLDSQRKPTATPKIRGPLEILPSVPLVQIDHIYANDLIEAGDVRVMHDAGSDHRAIATEVVIAND